MKKKPKTLADLPLAAQIRALADAIDETAQNEEELSADMSEACRYWTQEFKRIADELEPPAPKGKGKVKQKK